MNKKWIGFFFLLLSLTGCHFISSEGSTVETPQLEIPPIYGRWTITKCIFNDKLEDEDNFIYKELIGDDCYFAKDTVIIGKKYIENPSYRIKNLKAKKYFYKKYNLDLETLDFNGDYVTAIDIFDDAEFFYEILKDDNNQAFIVTNGVIIQITKNSEEISEKDLEESIVNKKIEIDKYENSPATKESLNGLLLGMKFTSESEIPTWSYKTFYIKFNNDHLENVYEVPNILLPRKNYFVDVEVQRKSKEHEISDKLVLKGRSKSENSLKDPGIYIDEESNVLKNIHYISSNCINIEDIDLNNEKNQLRIYLLDTIDKQKALDVRYFIDQQPSEERDYEEIKNFGSDLKNLGLYRDHGYWKLMGRLNLEDQRSYKDFDLNLLLPYEISKYNQLAIPMTELRKFHSTIDDAFISPNKRFLITLENNKLKIYNILNGKIVSSPLYERDIEKNGETIMTEWAIGKYADQWQSEISRKNKR
ncbi:MAG: hypothetical protein Q4P25_00465 [Tissierellia bacterium]|nr:hypothetical protein [Tissierellia bacterium]